MLFPPSCKLRWSHYSYNPASQLSPSESSIISLHYLTLAPFNVMKRLKLFSISLHTGVRRSIKLPLFENVIIQWHHGEHAEDTLYCLSNLRRLSFADCCDGQSAALAQQLVNSAQLTQHTHIHDTRRRSIISAQSHANRHLLGVQLGCAFLSSCAAVSPSI